jgi:hypothetical protein
VKKYMMTFADATKHIPAHPERTGYRAGEWDYYFQVWPTRAALLKALDTQGRRPAHRLDWKDWLTSNIAKRLAAK